MGEQILQASPLLLPSLLCWPSCYIAFIPPVVGSNTIGVILALIIADITAVSCFPAAVGIPLVLDFLTVAGSVADP
jgi:hypothetical protein